MPSSATTQWEAFTSYLPTRKNFAANTIEFSSTALQIASEIITFVGGLGFFVTPLIEEVYNQMLGKYIYYSVTGDIKLDFESPNITATDTIDNLPLFSSKILFNIPFPHNLFTASALLFSLGGSGLLLSSVLKKYGSSLHDYHQAARPTEQEINNAQAMNRRTAITSTALLIGSRGAAIYATSIISMTMTLRNVPSILENFSIYSSKNLTIDKNTFNADLKLAESIFFILNLSMKFITKIDFSELKKAAEKGSQNINTHEYYLGIAMAGLALFLGFAALKFQQKNDHYKNILLRHQHAQELLALENLSNEPNENSLANNRNRMFAVINPPKPPETKEITFIDEQKIPLNEQEIILNRMV